MVTTNQDGEHLRLLSIFHYVVAGLAALFSFLPLFYTAMGWFILHAPPDPHQKGGPPPEIFGWILIVVGVAFFLLGMAFSICVAISGRCLARRRGYWFAFVLACVECLFFPFGIILGVFTLIVLVRPAVKVLFGIAPAPVVGPASS